MSLSKRPRSDHCRHNNRHNSCCEEKQQDLASVVDGRCPRHSWFLQVLNQKKNMLIIGRMKISDFDMERLLKRKC